MQYSVEKLNEYVNRGTFDDIVNFAEIGQELQFENLVRIITERIGDSTDFCELILVTGPSSSGKTTFTNLLYNRLTELGNNVDTISLDDYYKDVEITQKAQREKGFVKTEFNEYNYETIDAFDVRKFRKNMREFLAGEKVDIPLFDFVLKRPNGIRKTIYRDGKDIIIVEGIQTMNKKLFNGLKFDRIEKIYISPFDSFSYDGKTVVSPDFVRLMRRAVRNNAHRGQKLNEMLVMWQNVAASEASEIEINKKYADFIYNSSTPYEVNYLAPKFLKMVEKLPKKYEKLLTKFANIEVLKYFNEVKELDLPDNVIFREFYY